MRYELMFPSNYLRAADFNGKDVTKTIADVQQEELMRVGGAVEKKYTLRFADTPKRLVLNKTNAKAIAQIHGKDTDAWKGKSITMYPTTCRVGPATEDCIRIRANGSAERRERRAPAADAKPQEELPPGAGMKDWGGQSAGSAQPNLMETGATRKGAFAE